MLSIFDDLLNLAKRIKDAVAHSDDNLQEAKNYTDTEVASLAEFEDLTSQISSGTSAYSIKSGAYTRCFRIGEFLFINVWGNATATLSTAMDLPYVRIPDSNPTLLAGGCSISGISYPLVTIGDWSGVKYLKQSISSNVTNGANIVFWAILKVGGVVSRLLQAHLERRWAA